MRSWPPLQEVKVSPGRCSRPCPPVSGAQKSSGKTNQTWTETFSPKEEEWAGAATKAPSHPGRPPGRPGFPGPGPCHGLTPANLGLPAARAWDLRMCEGISCQLELERSLGPRSPAGKLVTPRGWTRPSLQKQEELTGVNVSTVSAPGCNLLPSAARRGRGAGFVHLNIKCN